MTVPPADAIEPADYTFVDAAGDIAKGIWTTANDAIDTTWSYIVQVINHHAAQSPQVKKVVDTFKQYYPIVLDVGFGLACFYSFYCHPTLFTITTVAGFILSANAIPTHSFKALHQSILGKTEAGAQRAKLTTFLAGCVNYRSSQALIKNFCTIWTALVVGNIMWHHFSSLTDKEVVNLSQRLKLYELIEKVKLLFNPPQSPPPQADTAPNAG